MALLALERPLSRVGPQMLLQVRVLDEGLLALRTMEGSLPRVHLLVPNKRRPMPERLSTMSAAERRIFRRNFFLHGLGRFCSASRFVGNLCMNRHMSNKDGLGGEASRTIGAVVRPIAAVRPLVFHQRGTLRKPLIANGAAVRLFPGVGTMVFHQVRVLNERLAADSTPIRPVPGVRPEMLC